MGADRFRLSLVTKKVILGLSRPLPNLAEGKASLGRFRYKWFGLCRLDWRKWQMRIAPGMALALPPIKLCSGTRLYLKEKS